MALFEMPLLDQEKCNGCGLCVNVCSRGGLMLVEKIVVLVENVECDWCTECEAVCPTGAIRCPFEIVIEEH